MRCVCAVQLISHRLLPPLFNNIRSLTTHVPRNMPLTFEQISKLPASKVAGELQDIPPPPKVELGSSIESLFSPIPYERQIYCNRTLDMKVIKAIGFDMDYTLAQYIPETFECLAHRLTKENLVHVKGYPEIVLDFQFEWRFMQKGLTIDKIRGNVIKRDRHQYVKLAYHGFRELSKEDRNSIYDKELREELNNHSHYNMIDTLFSLAEAHTFMQLVELVDNHPNILGGKTYQEIYTDLRGAVDLCHRDGSLKAHVAADPEKYIYKDSSIVPILDNFRKGGKKLFLATNSLWDYANVVMNFLICGRVKEDKNDEWLKHFDVVITGCGKPEFFTSKRPLYEVHTPTGMLFNTDNGSPREPLDLTAQPQIANEEVCCLTKDGKARVFQSGYYTDLHRFLGVNLGSEVLYVGDHIFGDILKSKKSLNWRTMLVFPELEAELVGLQKAHGTQEPMMQARLERKQLEHEFHLYEHHLKLNPDDTEAKEVLQELHQKRASVKERYESCVIEHHKHFHSVWGQIMKAGAQNSFFAEQVERFACLYSSHVANLLLVTPTTFFEAEIALQPHENTLVSDELLRRFSFSKHVTPVRNKRQRTE
eukprot:m.341592 g.341592  ORF g.341592 m.341592 type:complete len:593 (+) comp20248_c0_seq1:226-2004(+)